MLNAIDAELNLPQNRRFHESRLKEKHSQFHYCLAVTYFLAEKTKTERARDHWRKWEYSSIKSDLHVGKEYSIDLKAELDDMDRDRWIAISKNIENKNWFAAEVHMYEFEEPETAFKQYHQSIGQESDEINNEYYKYDMQISIGLKDFSGVYHDKLKEDNLDNYSYDLVYDSYDNWVKNKGYSNDNVKFQKLYENEYGSMTYRNLDALKINASDSLYINRLNDNTINLKYFTENKYTPPSAIYSSNVYYSKNSNNLSYLLFDQSSIEESFPNYYMMGGGKYILIPENKELIQEKNYTNKLVGWGFISLALLKILIL